MNSAPENPRTEHREHIELLTVSEACDALRISKWSFYELVHRREIQTLRIGTRRLVPRSAIDDLIARRLESEDDR